METLPIEDDLPPSSEVDENSANTVLSGAAVLERILLIEDDEAVRQVLQKILEAEGYRVVEASTGDEGLSVFLTDPSFDLILTDIVMPGQLLGTEMIERIRDSGHIVKAIFLTGYFSDAANQSAERHSSEMKIFKPLGRQELLRAVKEKLAM